MALPFANTAEGGVNAATVTTSDTGSGDAFSAISIGASATLAYSTTFAASGSASIKFTQAASPGAVTYFGWDVGSITEIWGRCYIYRTANPTGSGMLFARAELSGTGACGFIDMNTSGQLRVWDSASTVSGFSTAIDLNAWNRVEFYVKTAAGTGVVEAKLFKGANLETNVPTEVVTLSSAQTRANMTHFYFGEWWVSDNSGVCYFDNLAVNGTGYPGPYKQRFPTIQTADTKTGTQASNATSWTLTYPTNLVSGDLILAGIAIDGVPSVTLPAGWKRARNTSGGAVTLVTAVKKSDGTETGNFTLSLGASEQGAWRIFRITGWDSSGTFPSDTDSAAEFALVGNGVETSVAAGASANPDPPTINPSNWDVADTLWIANCAADTSRTISVYPLIGLQTADVSGGSTGATLGTCTKNDTVASLDPGTFTISASDDWVAMITGVRPVQSSLLFAPFRQSATIYSL